jgi:hypothetical protein
LCQAGASFRFACKISSIPVLAAATLPGGAAGGGALVSAAGLNGLVRAPIGGWLTNRTSSKFTVILSGMLSAAGLKLVPAALGMRGDSSASFLSLAFSGALAEVQAASFSSSCASLELWGLAQGPSLNALAQDVNPAGAEAASMALPKAAGVGAYIFALFLLGLVTDALISLPGVECAAAGSATLLFLGLWHWPYCATRMQTTNSRHATLLLYKPRLEYHQRIIF